MKKRFFHLGPTTTLAIAGAIVLAYMRFPQWQREVDESRQLEAARAQLAHHVRATLPPPRTLDTLWKQRQGLNLAAPQIQSLQHLRTEEKIRTMPWKQNAEKAARALEAWMKTHRDGATMGDIQAQAAIYSAASADLMEARQRFWQRGLRLLTPPQRARIEGLTKVRVTNVHSTNIQS